MQRVFQQRLDIAAPSAKNIRWYKQFKEIGRWCERLRPGQPRTSEEAVLKLKAHENPLMVSAKKLDIPQLTAWGMLRWRLVMRPFRLHTLPALRAGDKAKHEEFKMAFYGIWR